MKLTMYRKDISLVPTAVADFDKISGLQKDTSYLVTITKIRSPRFHRKYFAMLKATMENMPDEMRKIIPDIENLLTELKFQTGYYLEYRTISGRVTYIPKSISFEKLDDLEFAEFYRKSEDVILKYFMKNVKREELEEFIIGFM